MLDNVRIAYHPHAGYGLFDGILRTAALRCQAEREMTERRRTSWRSSGWSGIQNELAKNLPYGEQRRVEIARALACDPKLLLLDEPAAGMNPAEIGRLMEFIHFIRDRFNLTILLIEHQMRLVMNICEQHHGDGLRRGDRPRHAEGDPGQPEGDRGVPGPRRQPDGHSMLLEVKDLNVYYGAIHALQGSRFNVDEGRNRHPDRRQRRRQVHHAEDHLRPAPPPRAALSVFGARTSP